MEETHVVIDGYNGLYEITKSGRIYSISRKRYLARCNDEYGFHIVKLSNKGVSKNHSVFGLWKAAFKDEDESSFKGAKKA